MMDSLCRKRKLVDLFIPCEAVMRHAAIINSELYMPRPISAHALKGIGPYVSALI